MMSERRTPGPVKVSRAEVKAAQMKVERMLARGEEPSLALLAIANAKSRRKVTSNGAQSS